MTKKLKNLIVNRVDLVDNGANPEARIVLAKRFVSPEAKAKAKADAIKRVREFEEVVVASEKRADDAERRADEAEERLRQTLTRPGRPRSLTTPVAKRAAEQNLTQDKIAKRAGISRSYVEAIEHGLVPPAAIMTEIAKALDTPVEELFPGPWTLEEAHDLQWSKESWRGNPPDEEVFPEVARRYARAQDARRPRKSREQP